jgi:sarcosine oxidase subunit gamma
MVDEALAARSSFENLSAIERISDSAGVVVTDRQSLGIATIMVRRGQIGALARHISQHYVIELPSANRRAEARGISFAAIGRDIWLAAAEQGGNQFAAALRTNLGALASTSDQTDGYAILRLSGPNVRETLVKLIPIDVHPRAFKVGDVASTVACHITVTLWRLNDAPDGAAEFELAVYRSFAGSLWDSLTQCAAEFGLAYHSEAT